MKLEEATAPDNVQFNGVTFRRMGGKRRYYLSLSKIGGRYKGLHVAIFEHYSGTEVPKGCEVHHKDGDTFNCEFGNLECLPEGEHRSMPKSKGHERQREICAAIRPLAVEWHRSPEGREWHRQHIYESIHKPGAVRPPARIIGTGHCKWCGEWFEKRRAGRVFCSSKCQLQESGYRRGRYKFVHAHFAAQECRTT